MGRYHINSKLLYSEYLALKGCRIYRRVGLARIVGVEEKVVEPLSTVRWTAWWRRARFSNSLWGWQPGTLPLYGEAALPSSGRMVCLDCGRAFPLSAPPSRGTDPAYSERPPI